jgi:20S proteasome alpha/beta subunit
MPSLSLSFFFFFFFFLNCIRRVLAVDKHHGAAVAGVYPDARKMVVRARNEGADYKLNYGSEIPTKVLSDR